MKKISWLIAIFFSSHVFAQTLPDVDLVKLEKAGDCKPAEPYVLITANYLLSTPPKKNNADRLKALQFIYKWMKKTPDYSFAMDETATKVTKDDQDILGVYLAAMVKYTLENKDSAKDVKLMRLNAMSLLLNYCNYKNNNIHMGKLLKKLAEANSKGELKQTLEAL